MAPGSADPRTAPRDPYDYVEKDSEASGAPTGGVVADETDADGPRPSSMDPLAKRAVSAYRQRLAHWLRREFVVRDSGSPDRILRAAKVEVRIQIGDEDVVVGYEIEPGSPAPLEAAARTALDAVVGHRVPPRPHHYPGPLQRWIHATFECSEATCS